MFPQFFHSWNHFLALGACKGLSPLSIQAGIFGLTYWEEVLLRVSCCVCLLMYEYFWLYDRVHIICFSVFWNIIIFHFCSEKLLKYQVKLDVVDQLEIGEVFQRGYKTQKFATENFDPQGSTKFKIGLDLTKTGCKVLFPKCVKKAALTHTSTYFFLLYLCVFMHL